MTDETQTDETQTDETPAAGAQGPAAQTGTAPTEETVRDMLRTVFDPEIGINIVDLGLVYEIEVADLEDEPGKKTKIVHTLTTPACPVGPMIRAQIEQAASTVEGIEAVEIELVFSPPWDPKEMCSEEAKFELGIF